tara:strand:- start:603 stop:1571 length:969 start_codon:yes stop_codon:yes gene_type:complete
MAIQYLHNINLNDNELQNAKLHVTDSAPTASAGQIYFHSSSGTIRVHNGSGWSTLSTDQTDDFITYSTSVVSSSGIKLRLTGTPVSGSTTTDDVKFTGSQNITISRTDDSTINIQGFDGAYSSLSGTPSEFTPSSHNHNNIYYTETEIDGMVVKLTGNQSIAGNKTFSNNVTVSGNLTVTGTTTTNNVEVVSTSNGVVFEGSAADANEGTLLAGTLSADRTYTLPNKSGTVAMTSDIRDAFKAITITGNGSATSFNVDHNFALSDLIDVSIQVVDSLSSSNTYGQTVVVGVDRTTANRVVVSFGSAPANGQTYKVHCIQMGV